MCGFFVPGANGMEQKWVRVSDVAAKYGLKQWYVFNLRRLNPEVMAMTRKLPGTRGPVLFNAKEFDAWIEAQK